MANENIALVNIENKEDFFGPMWPFLNDQNVTEVDWNGKALWIDDYNKGRYQADVVLDPHFIDTFTMRVSNLVNCSFNAFTPVLEAETDTHRISIIHENAVVTGRSIAIRVTPKVRRISGQSMIEDKYCTDEWIKFAEAAVKAHLNISIAGLPGVGKTEYLKMLTSYIPNWERVITIEDNLEIHYTSINPDADAIEVKVNDHMTYSEAIKASLRQNPKWLMLSETRGQEVKDLMTAWSTGINGMTTIHTDSVKKIPDRMLNMSGKYEETMNNDIYSFLDLGISIVSIRNESTGRFQRRIHEAALFSRTNGENKITMLYEDGKFLTDKLPEDIMYKFDLYNVANPLKEFNISNPPESR